MKNNWINIALIVGGIIVLAVGVASGVRLIDHYYVPEMFYEVELVCHERPEMTLTVFKKTGSGSKMVSSDTIIFGHKCSDNAKFGADIIRPGFNDGQP